MTKILIHQNDFSFFLLLLLVMNDDFNFWTIIVGDLFYKFFWYFCVINLLFHFHKNAAFRTIASVDY